MPRSQLHTILPCLQSLARKLLLISHTLPTKQRTFQAICTTNLWPIRTLLQQSQKSTRNFILYIYIKQVFVVLVLLASASVNRTKLLCQINLRNSASRWLSLLAYITMYGPLNVKFSEQQEGNVSCFSFPSTETTTVLSMTDPNRFKREVGYQVANSSYCSYLPCILQDPQRGGLSR